jgi:hypothetical protein
MMRLIFIHGPAGSGKLTVGRELQKLTGLRLFHNHLVVDTLLSVFQFGTDSFVRLREQIWLSVFQEAAEGGISLIFTFAPEATVNPEFIDRTVSTVEAAGGKVLFVELTCPVDELERRIEDPSRAEFLKLRSVEIFRKVKESNGFRFPPLPSSGLTIDTGETPPADSARRICEFFGLPILTDGAIFDPYPS